MKLQKRTTSLMVAAIPFVLAGLELSAQEFASARIPSSNVVKPVSIDSAFVGKNMRDNKMEIELSQLALTNSSNQDVKKVAQRMVGDHTAILNDLAKIAQNNNMLAIPGYPTNGVASGTAHENAGMTAGASTAPSTAGSGSANNNQATGSGAKNSSAATSATSSSSNTGSYNNLGTSGTTTAAAPNANGQPQHSDHTKMQAAAALQGLTGQAFDRQWIPQMLAMHDAKLAELTSAVNGINDSDLKTAVNTAIPKIRMHRDILSSLNTSKGSK